MHHFHQDTATQLTGKIICIPIPPHRIIYVRSSIKLIKGITRITHTRYVHFSAIGCSKIGSFEFIFSFHLANHKIVSFRIREKLNVKTPLLSVISPGFSILFIDFLKSIGKNSIDGGVPNTSGEKRCTKTLGKYLIQIQKRLLLSHCGTLLVIQLFR